MSMTADRSAADAEFRDAVRRFALLKAPAVVMVVGLLGWLFLAPPETLSPGMTPILVTAGVFVHLIYTAVLFWLILLPALERKSAAVRLMKEA